MKTLDECLAKVSSCFKGEKHSPYLNGENSGDFVFPEASEFRVKVWREISKIPAGQTRTYSEIAAALGGEKYRRAVAGAVAANVFLIMVPCHRVVGKKGLGGFSGDGGVKMKKILLTMESGDAN
ncbi:MAG: methylated-DNA--[protein]-cysteine S-methyltransferase [Candidatus Mycalebacterium zealandia]|nr:MAG: methylated-DNA--[protein]-cysteine S-methyltransferase [Candidatus Mycalebacterium zealandia]